MLRTLLTAAVCAVALSACVHTNEMPLAPNMVRLDTQAQGLLFQGQAGTATLKRAAELTLKSGYTHFRLEQAAMGQGAIQGGGTFSAVGNTVVYNEDYIPTANAGATVVMFHANEPGAKGAFDAATVLEQYSS